MVLHFSLKRIKLQEVSKDLYHLCIGLLPVLYAIYVPVLNVGLGTIILLGFVPYAIMFIPNRNFHRSRINSLPFFLFYFYLLFRLDGNISRIILCAASFINLYGQINGAIETEKLRKVVEAFSILNVLLLVIQVISFYLLHFRIQYIPQNLIFEEYRNSYVFEVAEGLYRPSALFLEPSHFAQYCIFALISALFPARGPANVKKALLIGIGCILTTSGMGIALTAWVFFWYVIFDRQTVNVKMMKLVKWIPVVLIGVFILSRQEFFQTAIQRVFSNVDGYNAISGRTHNWEDAVGKMTGETLWIGYGDSQEYPWYLTGLADTIYKYGIIGAVLQGACFAYVMIKKMDNFVWCCCIVFIGLFFVAHLTNFMAQVFYFGMIISEAIVPDTIRTMRMDDR